MTKGIGQTRIDLEREWTKRKDRPGRRWDCPACGRSRPKSFYRLTADRQPDGNPCRKCRQAAAQ